MIAGTRALQKPFYAIGILISLRIGLHTHNGHAKVVGVNILLFNSFKFVLK